VKPNLKDVYIHLYYFLYVPFFKDYGNYAWYDAYEWQTEKVWTKAYGLFWPLSSLL